MTLNTEPREIRPTAPNTLEQMAATPGSIVIDGTEYEVPQLTAGRTAEFSGWYRQNCRREHMGAVIDLNLRGADKIDALRAFQPPDTMAVFEGMTQPDGLVRILWLSLREKHPHLTEKKIGAALTVPQVAQAAKDLLGIDETRMALEDADGAEAEESKNPDAAT